ncbi:unnamed protein product [Gongylonema pulchrum]|uniref:Uncharacterized protein n=1 Tax=Gongylonema pulchrum TaxID=637853 RepID=A0A3P7PNV7_9BILA|nr:unnamed protein product [Gongylonema pulchrum]
MLVDSGTESDDDELEQLDSFLSRAHSSDIMGSSPPNLTSSPPLASEFETNRHTALLAPCLAFHKSVVDGMQVAVEVFPRFAALLSARTSALDPNREIVVVDVEELYELQIARTVEKLCEEIGIGLASESRFLRVGESWRVSVSGGQVLFTSPYSHEDDDDDDDVGDVGDVYEMKGIKNCPFSSWDSAGCESGIGLHDRSGEVSEASQDNILDEVIKNSNCVTTTTMSLMNAGKMNERAVSAGGRTSAYSGKTETGAFRPVTRRRCVQTDSNQQSCTGKHVYVHANIYCGVKVDKWATSLKQYVQSFSVSSRGDRFSARGDDHFIAHKYVARFTAGG